MKRKGTINVGLVAWGLGLVICGLTGCSDVNSGRMEAENPPPPQGQPTVEPSRTPPRKMPAAQTRQYAQTSPTRTTALVLEKLLEKSIRDFEDGHQEPGEQQ